MGIHDPVEAIIANGLTRIGISYSHEVNLPDSNRRIDFYLPRFQSLYRS